MPDSIQTKPATSASPQPPRRGGAGRSSITTGHVGRAIFVLALPVLGEQMLNALVGLFDTWLAGQINAAATSAIGLAAYVGWLASMIVMLIGTGTTALVSRHEGAGDHEQANHCMNQSIILGAMLGAGLLVFLFLLAPWAAKYTNMSGDAFTITVGYLRIDAFGHTFMGITLVGCAALRGVGNMRTPMLIFALINSVNVVASCTFVFFFNWGIHGIVAGTVTAKIIGAAATVLVLMRGQSGLVLMRRELSIAWSTTCRILRIGLPAAADGAAMWVGHFALLAIIARLADPPWGQAYFAAHIIAIRIESFTYLPATAWAAATATMVGQSLGAKAPRRARQAGHQAVLQCGLLSVVIAVLFYFGAGFIYRTMSLDPLVRAAGTAPFKILSLFQPCLVVSIVYIGGLRGAGDTRFPLLITLTGIVLRLSLGYYFGLVLGWGLIGAWMGMFADMLWRTFAAALRYGHGKWTETCV